MKRIQKSRFRVVLEIRDTMWVGRSPRPEDDCYRDAKALMQEVKRHCNYDIDPYITHDTMEVCSFCGCEWKEQEDGCPDCCPEAQAEWEAQQAVERVEESEDE